MGFDDTHIWVTNAGSSSVSKINLATNTVIGTVPVGSSPLGIAFDGINIWVANQTSSSVSKIVPS